MLFAVSQTSVFIVLIVIYLIYHSVFWFLTLKILPQKTKYKLISKITIIYDNVANILEGDDHKSISRIELIELAMNNMKAKRARTFITVGGMAIGISAIVFLVSIGYGLQQLVITRVARLEEMKQADVASQAGNKMRLNDETINSFYQIQNIASAIPIIAVVGRVNFNDSVSDMAVYGVTTKYLQQSAVKPVRGKIFESNEVVIKDTAENMPQEYKPNFKDKIRDIEYTVDNGVWLEVRESPTPEAPLIGYTRRIDDIQRGIEVWGSEYQVTNSTLEKIQMDKWINAPFFLWKKEACSTESPDCIDGSYVILKSANGNQLNMEGFVIETNIAISTANQDSTLVLGVKDVSLGDKDTATLDFVELPSEITEESKNESTKVMLGSKSLKQAVVNRALLKVLGIKEEEAVGKNFSVSFIVTGDLLQDRNKKIESYPTEYSISAVVPDDKTPIFYVPFIDLRSLGVSNYSQVKLTVGTPEDLPKARKQVEALGYSTRSVADTVNQINNLFDTARTVSGLLGMVALSVAALGMFNTLTVSLLERTREVGLMKALGMKSYEVRELFLTESMIMGFFGGLLGLFFGFLAGELLGFVLSIFSVTKGAGYLDISYIPGMFVGVIVILSLAVGLLTGIYPAKRATKISALDALRYE
jgi:ABC-type antimicrobial peptide transport system permease subunit